MDAALSELARAGTVGFEFAYGNHNASFYRGRFADRAALLKVVVGKVGDTVDTQYAALVDLHTISSVEASFAVPHPLARVPGHPAYIMEEVRGELLQRTLPRSSVRALRSTVELSACALAAIHRRWVREDAAASDIPAIVADLITNAPSWLPTPASTLRRAADRLAGERFPTVRLYADFDPCNVLHREYEPPVFLDPPDVVLVGVPHWDLATYTSGLQRAYWRRPWAATTRRDACRSLRAAFLHSYFRHFGGQRRRADDLLVLVLEMARLAQLACWWSSPTSYRRVTRGFGRAIYTAPLVRAAWCARVRRVEAAVGHA